MDLNFSWCRQSFYTCFLSFCFFTTTFSIINYDPAFPSRIVWILAIFITNTSHLHSFLAHSFTLFFLFYRLYHVHAMGQRPQQQQQERTIEWMNEKRRSRKGMVAAQMYNTQPDENGIEIANEPSRNWLPNSCEIQQLLNFGRFWH